MDFVLGLVAGCVGTLGVVYLAHKISEHYRCPECKTLWSLGYETEYRDRPTQMRQTRSCTACGHSAYRVRWGRTEGFGGAYDDHWTPWERVRQTT